MYEKKYHALAPFHVYVKRIIANFFIGLLIIILSLILGMCGYMWLEDMSLIDAYENAAMILSGMGPVLPLKTAYGKIFAATYALFSGVVFLAVIAILFAPIFHRFFHRFLIKDDK